MERTKEKTSGKIKWLKTGGGSFRMKNGRIIKSNQTFFATVEEIPEGFRNAVKPLDDLPEEEPLKTMTTFELKSVKDGLYDVVNVITGKAMNEEPMSQAPAEKLLGELS